MKQVRVIAIIKIIMVVIAMLSLSLHVSSHPVDSLYVKFQNCGDKEKLALANSIFEYLNQEKITESLYQYPASAKLPDVELQVHYWMAEYYFDKQQFVLSLEAIDKAEILSRDITDKSLRSDVLSVFSNVNFRLGHYDKTLKGLLEAYKIDLSQGDEILISSDLNSLAAVYLAIQQPQSGIRFIEQAISIERKLKRPDRLAIRLGMASELYLMDGDLDKAMTAIDEAYAIDSEAGRDEKAAIRLSQKGAVLVAQSHLEEALAVTQRAFPMLEKAENTYSLAVCSNQLASIYEKLGNRSAAISCYKQALEHSIKCGSPKTERIAEKGLWQTLREENPAIAMIHLERYTALTDSLHAQLAATKMAVMDITVQSMSQEKMNADKHRMSNIIKWGGFVIVILLFLMLGLMTYAWRKNKGVMEMQRQTQEMKSHLSANLTNELQTPLTVIMNAGRLLLDKNGKNSANENRKLGEMIVSHGNSMLGLVNQLLDIENIKTASEQPMMKCENIVMFVRLLVENFDAEVRNKRVNLEFVSPLKSLIVDFSPEYLRRIVHTLVTNAINFTPQNGQVTVSVEPPENGQLRLVVADNGKGIPAEELSRLYEPMTQSADNDDNGADVSAGLTHVKQMVEALNGNISFESEEGKGTTFTIILPVQVIKGIDGQEESEVDMSQFAEDRLRKDSRQLPLVFIVENNEDVAFFVTSLLSENYHLRLARDGREALNNAEDLVPDLVITSMNLPVMDGRELINQLRSTPALRHIPIIAMTSNPSEQERLNCIEAGADNVLVKPFNSDELRLVANQLLSQRAILRDYLLQSGTDSTRVAQPEPIKKEDRAFLSKLVGVIYSQMAKDDIDMEHIAAALSMSRKQLRARVLAITGLSPVAFVLQVRLNYARRMITTTSTPVTKIATRCGFQTLSHFSKAFKQQFGVSPQQYRKGQDNVAALPPKPKNHNAQNSN